MDQFNMVGNGLMKDEKVINDYGFSISIGIIESSITSLGTPSTDKEYGSLETLPVTIKNVKRENPGQSSKKIRKRISSQSRTVKTTNIADDGYGWRKYGQKIIHNQQYPKNYYRCTHQKEENCEAKKWIQQESENPPIYKTTYLGQHTCKNPHKIPQIFFSDYSSQFSSSDNILDGTYSSVSSQPFILRFNSPEANHVISQAEQITDEMGLNDDKLPPTMSPVNDGNESNGYFASIFPSPSCSFGSYDFDMMMQDYFLLDLDNVNSHGGIIN